MIEEILKLRKEGLIFRKIAEILETTTEKVQYLWNEHSNGLPGSISGTKRIGKALKVSTSGENKGQTCKSLRGDEHILAVLQNAQTIFLFWKISEAKKVTFATSIMRPVSSLVPYARIYDITGILFNGSNQHMYMDVPMNEDAETWRFTGLKQNRSYILDVGYKEHSLDFVPVLRSNPVHTPGTDMNVRDGLAADMDRWKSGLDHRPNWIEHVSTYSFYEIKQ